MNEGIDYYDANQLLIKGETFEDWRKMRAKRYAEAILELGSVELAAKKCGAHSKNIYCVLSRAKISVKEILLEREKLNREM